MNRWKSLISEGNTAFNQEHWELALSKYQQAMLIAQDDYLKQLKADANAALASILVAFFNLADTYLQTNHCEQANEQYDLCFLFLEKQLEHSYADSEFNHAVMKAYSVARIEWNLFKQKPKGKLCLSDPPAMHRIEHNIQCANQMH